MDVDSNENCLSAMDAVSVVDLRISSIPEFQDIDSIVELIQLVVKYIKTLAQKLVNFVVMGFRQDEESRALYVTVSLAEELIKKPHLFTSSRFDSILMYLSLAQIFLRALLTIIHFGYREANTVYRANWETFITK